MDGGGGSCHYAALETGHTHGTCCRDSEIEGGEIEELDSEEVTITERHDSDPSGASIGGYY